MEQIAMIVGVLFILWLFDRVGRKKFVIPEGCELCKNCNGSGSGTCYYCNGSGREPGYTYGGEYCHRCEGKGVLRKCHVCDGDGYHTIRKGCLSSVIFFAAIAAGTSWGVVLLVT
ncbi:hypothetical protein DES53_10758 [Roseimicrobium gellanilyticum]|uniref:Uncharacterized protein n=1 Tax=Roseimicrobium gellanilyticum TaxID=748857 RepID=A0A366HFC4_9BACT|nr:hypothetical protein [Roseimicrobium gellanilyticum]RBP41227.1 hypothetical protein DES53_10758 [Roseimicrobium gellanilyticum]